MGDVTQIRLFRKRKLERAEVEFYELMNRAAAFEHEGKRAFANEMVSKAKEVRKVIDSLRRQVAKDTVPYLTRENAPKLSIHYEGLFGNAGVDLGYPKISPETTPTA